MSIEIKPETEDLIREELRQGHFQSIDELILSGVRAWRASNLAHEPAAPQKSGTEKAREFVFWAKSHPHTPPLSDDAVSRANLNPDRW